ncbi:MAG TPA: hypothetical protein VFW19_07480 [Allosphingosinicella sp.]|nr:hypothetical protein [Allosphingosinicella sp.]
MRRIGFSIALCVAAAAMPAQARYVSPGFAMSWGKAGVSLADYRSDAVACGRHAAGLDLAGTGPARSFKAASRILENGSDYDTWVAALQIAAPERNLEKAGDLMQATLDRCLVERGYHKFKLTSEQRHRLSKLKMGSDQRHAYLHSLAADPDVLSRQAAD